MAQRLRRFIHGRGKENRTVDPVALSNNQARGSSIRITFPISIGPGTVSVILTLMASGQHPQAPLGPKSAAQLRDHRRRHSSSMCSILYLFLIPRQKRSSDKLGEQRAASIINKMVAFFTFCVGIQIVVTGIAKIFHLNGTVNHAYLTPNNCHNRRNGPSHASTNTDQQRRNFQRKGRDAPSRGNLLIRRQSRSRQSRPLLFRNDSSERPVQTVIDGKGTISDARSHRCALARLSVLQHDDGPAGRRSLVSHYLMAGREAAADPATRIHRHPRRRRSRLRTQTGHRQRDAPGPAHLSERSHDLPDLGTRRFPNDL